MLWILLLLCTASGLAEETIRDGRVFSPFSVVRFPNDVCGGASRNGTCLTSEMCEDQSGKTDGTCADGFGVCCIFELSCGKASSQNNTYIVQTSTTTQPVTGNSECAYTICPASANIRRIRYDFTTSKLADPASATIVSQSAVNAIKNHGSVGKCVDDSFSITGSSGTTPAICGTNTGEHMIVDSDGMACHSVNFQISTKSFARSWDIWVTQYDMSDLDSTRAGPYGCLQYHTMKTGYIKSFALPDISDAGAGTTATTTHLANQQYNICIRRASSSTKICYFPKSASGAPTDVAKMGSYGIGVNVGKLTKTTKLITASASKVLGVAATVFCSVGDYLDIPGLAKTPGTLTSKTESRICGRWFATPTTTAISSHQTMCTYSTPFRVTVNFDDGERNDRKTTTTAKSKLQLDEQQGYPSGTIGFGLYYAQS